MCGWWAVDCKYFDSIIQPILILKICKLGSGRGGAVAGGGGDNIYDIIFFAVLFFISFN